MNREPVNPAGTRDPSPPSKPPRCRSRHWRKDEQVRPSHALLRMSPRALRRRNNRSASLHHTHTPLRSRRMRNQHRRRPAPSISRRQRATLTPVPAPSHPYSFTHVRPPRSARLLMPSFPHTQQTPAVRPCLCTPTVDRPRAPNLIATRWILSSGAQTRCRAIRRVINVPIS